MRTFEKFNPAGDPCPICGEHTEDEETVLIPIPSTLDGNLCEAKQVHLYCIDLQFSYTRKQGDTNEAIIYMIFDEKKGEEESND